MEVQLLNIFNPTKVIRLVALFEVNIYIAMSRINNSPVLILNDGLSAGVSSESVSNVIWTTNKYLAFPFPEFSIVKHHQWTALSREFIEFLQTSPTAIYVNAFMEFGLIPDEVAIIDLYLIIIVIFRNSSIEYLRTRKTYFQYY